MSSTNSAERVVLTLVLYLMGVLTGLVMSLAALPNPGATEPPAQTRQFDEEYLIEGVEPFGEVVR